MEIDGYWRTRTIAEAEAQGYSHLRVTCSGCGRITDLPWPLLLRRRGIGRETFLGNIPLRCQHCSPRSFDAIGSRNSIGGIGEGKAAFQAVCELDLKGIVAKRMTDAYEPGRTKWWKVLNPSYTQKEGRAELFERR
jgi:hypothetical protein